MAGYVIVEDRITNEAAYAEFREKVGATVEAHGGRFLVRGGETEVFQGEWRPERIVVIEFDSVERAREWLHSPEFSKIWEIGARSVNASVIIAQGV